jgi:hypothetical protein
VPTKGRDIKGQPPADAPKNRAPAGGTTASLRMFCIILLQFNYEVFMFRIGTGEVLAVLLIVVFVLASGWLMRKIESKKR